MQWSERPPVVHSRIAWLEPLRSRRRSPSVAVAHLILVRPMQRRPNRGFRVLLTFIAAYATLWALTAFIGPRAVRPRMISDLAVDSSFRELRATADVYDAVGHVYALQFCSYAPFCITVRWARSDQDFGSSETELFVWLGRAFHVYSFKNSGGRRERPNQAMERTSGSFASSLSMKFHPLLAATRSDSHCPMLTLRAKVHLPPLPAGSIPASRRPSCSR
jgi:hypothetical protein